MISILDGFQLMEENCRVLSVMMVLMIEGFLIAFSVVLFKKPSSDEDFCDFIHPACTTVCIL